MSWWDTASSWFSSGSSSSSNSGMWSSILSGVGSYASDYLKRKDDKDTLATSFENALEAQRQKGIEERRTLSYAAELEDYYNQQNKLRDRTAVSPYGKFNLMQNLMPTTSTPISTPTKPSLENYHNA